MLYIKPDYYEKFRCIADRCEATCCAGWQIVIDEDSLKRYESEASVYGAVLRDRILWDEGVFKQDGCKRCAFLKENNLCDMYEKLGEESLCYTCTSYPRHTEEFENIREITLAISCPEVARIILSQKEPVSFVEEEIVEEEEEMDDFDPFLFSYLEDARKIILAILQNRSLSIDVRVALVQTMAEEMQEIIDESDIFDLVDVFDKYEDEAYLTHAIEQIKQDLSGFYKDSVESYVYSKAVFGRLYELEYLSDNWGDYLEHCWTILYNGGAHGYSNLQDTFKNYCQEHSFDGISLEIILEQLLVYFVFTYLCGAVYDDNVVGKIRLSVDSVTIIYDMLMAKWAEQEGHLCTRDIQRVVYHYSRELEHSDLNLDTMEG